MTVLLKPLPFHAAGELVCRCADEHHRLLQEVAAPCPLVLAARGGSVLLRGLAGTWAHQSLRPDDVDLFATGLEADACHASPL